MTIELFTFHCGSGPGAWFVCELSLYPTSTRFGAPAEFGSNRICQYAELAEKNAALTPWSIAFWTFSRMPLDQYSSCPTERKTR